MHKPISKEKIAEIIKTLRENTYMQTACVTGTTFDTVKYYADRYNHGYIDRKGNVLKGAEHKPRRAGFARGKAIKDISAMYTKDMAADNLGLHKGDKVTIHRTFDPNDKEEPKSIKGTIEGIYKYFFLVKTNAGYRTSVSKADIVSRFKILKRA